MKALGFFCSGAVSLTLLLTAACAGPVDHQEGAAAGSASGARYGDQTIELWTKGTEMMLRRGDGEESVTCSRNARASQIETSKLGGYDYWAVGNEPGWKLEIGPRRIVWTTDYGETRHEVATPAPEVDGVARTTVFRTELEGVRLVFTVVGETCSDDMSGEEFPTRFRIDHGERLYRGCGQALH